MTSALVTSDWHFDAVTAGVARYDELTRYVEIVCNVLERENIDHLFFAGDLTDPGGMLASLYASSAIVAAREFHRRVRGSVWIAGNHDVIEDSRGVTTLSPIRSALSGTEEGADFHVFERPGFAELDGIGVLAIPYVARDVEEADFDADLSAAILAAAAYRGPVGVIGHLSVPGARLSSESVELARGRDVDFPAGDILALDPVWVVNGHYHEAQIVKYGGLEIIIPGSPVRFTFGERNDDLKGFTILEW